MKLFLVWLFTIIITLGAAVYQRISGPTYPKRERIKIDNTEYKLSLVRSHGGASDAPIELKIDREIEATLFFKNYPVQKDEEWKQVVFTKEQDKYTANLPNQPAAGKLMYYISIKSPSGNIDVDKNNPVVLRFKGDVPAWILIPHVIFMFFAMFFSNLAGLYAGLKMKYYLRYTYVTLVLLTLGGMILGPIVQYYAFGELWTGVPYGWDLTDNKTLIGFIFYAVAVLAQLKRNRPYLTIIAAVVVLVIFSIPHSAFGSELDRSTGTITQGLILLFGR